MVRHEVRIIKTEAEVLILAVDNKEMTLPWAKLSTRLTEAKHEERVHIEISPNGYGLHWPLIDEDLSIDGILRDFSLSTAKNGR